MGLAKSEPAPAGRRTGRGTLSVHGRWTGAGSSPGPQVGAHRGRLLFTPASVQLSGKPLSGSWGFDFLG